MKSKLLLTLPLIVLTSCGGASSSHQTGLSSSSSSASSEPKTLKIAVPAGAPAISLYKYVADETNVEVNANPANVVSYLSASSGKDVVIVPTNAGMNAIVKKSAPYKIAATVTFGNFYLAATGNDADATLDDDDYVVAFQQNNVPDKIFKYCYPTLSNVHYVDAASDAAKCIISGKNESDNNANVDYVLIAEPALANALSKNANASEYANLQEVYASKSGNKEIAQASIFISNNLDAESGKAFLAKVKSDVESFLDDPTVLEASLGNMDQTKVQSKFSAPIAMIKKMTSQNNRMGLGFKYAKDNKEAIANFCSLFGINDIDETVYYQ